MTKSTTLTARWYQTAANDAVWQYLIEKSGNPVVVLPTGAGKSLVIAMLIRQALEFGGRVVVLAHRKELLQQNADELRGLIPGVDVGVYSAGLKSREIHNDVVIAGIQSVFRKAPDLGRRHLVLVDECHLCSDLEESMYQTFFAGIDQPGLRIVGLSATPFRTGTGPICGPDRQFHRIVFEAKTSQLIEQGFLCPITNKPADNQVSTDGVAIRGGEFVESDLQRAFGQEDKVNAACREMIDKCQRRHSILVFASGVHHAEEIAKTINSITAQYVGVVTGETLDIERATLLADFKAGRLRWLVNCDVLTTGFNARNIDAIVVLRATMSPGLFCQIVGRGLRLHESKTNCLLLDFGGNIARHGSIDDENFGRSDERKTSGKRDAVAAANGRGKPCPSCGLDVAANSRTCPECSFIFPVNHEAKADTEGQLTGAMPPETWQVKDVITKVHTPKREGDSMVTPSVRVDYVVAKEGSEGNLAQITISEWICPQHSGFARSKFLAWWDAHTVCDAPDTSADCVELLKMGVARWPVAITTTRDGKWYRVTEHDFGGREKPTTLEEQPEDKVYSGIDEDCPF
jgi:DNA repair protein RadD